MPRTSVTATSFGAGRNQRQTMSRSAARAAVIAASRGASTRGRHFGEMKHVDVNYAGVTLNATSTSVTLLNGVATGVESYNRIGTKIDPYSVYLNFQVTNDSTAAGAWNWLRVSLIWDRQPTGTLPTYSEIFQNVNAAGTTSVAGLVGRNSDTTDRFYTIANKELFLTPKDANSGGRWMQFGSIYKSLKGLKQQFKGTSAAIGSISTGALYLVLAGGSDATNTTTVFTDTRFRYTDI